MSKDKWVRRFTVNESAKHKNFTIYKITSVLFPLEYPDAATIVSVWKRYSDVQKLHKNMKSLHSGLHLSGPYPILPAHGYFKRFQKKVIEERAYAIKELLEFIAKQKLLFASTEFVNFLQTGYPEPDSDLRSGINMDAALKHDSHMSLLDRPNDIEIKSHPLIRSASQIEAMDSQTETLDCSSISQIKIFEPVDVEIREKTQSPTNSLESIDSLSISSDFYEEISKISLEHKANVRNKLVLPDLINFEMPSTSRLDCYTKKDLSDTESATSTHYDNSACGTSSIIFDDSITCASGSSAQSARGSKKSVLCTKLGSKSKMEGSYVFEAGHILNLASRCEDIKDYKKAFEHYKAGIEILLNGVKNDADPERRSLVKQNINKYLTYAETVCTKHLQGTQFELLLERDDDKSAFVPLPLSMLQRPYEELALYKVIGILGPSVMLVQNRESSVWYAMKVIQKVPLNLTDFDDFYTRQASNTKSPILPTAVPYMVTLHGYIETENLIFLLITYLPGLKLVEYIQKHQNTYSPSRNSNLNNVFTDSKSSKNLDLKPTPINKDDEVTELVKKSQKLLVNVDRVLNLDFEDVECKELVVDSGQNEESMVTVADKKIPLHPSSICKWGAEILTALESLHETGVICRDLNMDNILLGNKGQATLTYIAGYRGSDVTLSKMYRQTSPDALNMYVAPEVYLCTVDRERSYEEKVCDFWTFGAIMYRLLCGVCLSDHHKSVFTGHTELIIPQHVSLEAKSLLSQLLTYDPSERLGAGKEGIKEIKQHPYFKSIDWTNVLSSWLSPDD